MNPDLLRSPTAYLAERLGALPGELGLEAHEAWWEREGRAITDVIDRGRTPWLRMFDAFGDRVDEVLLPPEYRRLLLPGYRAGIVWRAFAEGSLRSPYLLGYVTSFYDPGLYCPYTVSLATAAPVAKYGGASLRERFLPQLLRRDDGVWQGATWMTEAAGGSDLGAAVQTVARPAGDRWVLNGDKYFASNIGAELAVVAARPEGAPAGVRGLALFLVPRRREDGSLNYTVRRIKDKIATRSVPTGEVELRDTAGYLLGTPEGGIYLILEVLTLSRVANSVGSVAVTQRALADALAFAGRRAAFGRPVLQHPLLRRQFEERVEGLEASFALAWEAVRLLDEVWQEQHPYSDRYHLARLVSHLAKYWTAEVAAQTGKWAMEVHGGAGALEEFGVERWLREAMILAIWEGTPHRQILDGLEAMERKGAHRLLFDHLGRELGPIEGAGEMAARVERHLALPVEEREAEAGDLVHALAGFVARALRRPAGVAAGGPPGPHS